MLEIAFAKLSAPKSGVVAIPVAEGAELSPAAAALDKVLGGALTRAVAAAKFTGKKASSAVILAPSAAFKRVVLLGLGKDSSARAAEEVGGALVAALGKEDEILVLADGLTP